MFALIPVHRARPHPDVPLVPCIPTPIGTPTVSLLWCVYFARIVIHSYTYQSLHFPPSAFLPFSATLFLPCSHIYKLPDVDVKMSVWSSTTSVPIQLVRVVSRGSVLATMIPSQSEVFKVIANSDSEFKGKVWKCPIPLFYFRGRFMPVQTVGTRSSSPPHQLIPEQPGNEASMHTHIHIHSAVACRCT